MELLKEFLISEREELLAQRHPPARWSGVGARLPDHVGEVLDRIGGGDRGASTG